MPTQSGRPLKLAVFDCDGTLVDSQHSIVSAMHAAFDALGLERPGAEAVRRVVGLPLTPAIALLAPGVDGAVHDSLTEGYKDAFGRLRRQGEVADPLYPGARDAIAELQDAGWILGIATGKSRRGLLMTLEQHGLTGRFVTLQTSDTGPGKPHPDMLFRAMAETGAEAPLTVMIGDTTFDMEMARSAGTLVIGVSWGYHEVDELRGAGAHMIIDDYGALAKTAETLMETVS